MASSDPWAAGAIPYDNAKAESFMKTLKVEAVYETQYRAFRGRRARPAALHRAGLQRSAAALVAGVLHPSILKTTTPMALSTSLADLVHTAGFTAREAQPLTPGQRRLLRIRRNVRRTLPWRFALTSASAR